MYSQPQRVRQIQLPLVSVTDFANLPTNSNLAVLFTASPCATETDPELYFFTLVIQKERGEASSISPRLPTPAAPSQVKCLLGEVADSSELAWGTTAG